MYHPIVISLLKKSSLSILTNYKPRISPVLEPTTSWGVSYWVLPLCYLVLDLRGTRTQFLRADFWWQNGLCLIFVNHGGYDMNKGSKINEKGLEWMGKNSRIRKISSGSRITRPKTNPNISPIFDCAYKTRISVLQSGNTLALATYLEIQFSPRQPSMRQSVTCCNCPRVWSI